MWIGFAGAQDQEGLAPIGRTIQDNRWVPIATTATSISRPRSLWPKNLNRPLRFDVKTLAEANRNGLKAQKNRPSQRV